MLSLTTRVWIRHRLTTTFVHVSIIRRLRVSDFENSVFEIRCAFQNYDVVHIKSSRSFNVFGASVFGN